MPEVFASLEDQPCGVDSGCITRIGVFSNEEIRLAGLLSLFDEALTANERRLSPESCSMKELLSDRGIGYVLLDLSDWQEKKRILDTIHRGRPDLRLLVIGPYDEETILYALRSGAKAYIEWNTPIERMRMAISTAVSGMIWAPRKLISKILERLLSALDQASGDAGARLTAREEEVLKLILAARSNREIAEHLGIEERTVKAHVGRLMRKTGAGNRVGLSVRALDPSSALQSQSGERRALDRRSGERRKE